MSISLKKYYGDKSDEVGGLLVWPGTPDGYPIKSTNGQTLNLKQQEFEDIPLRVDFRSRRFRLCDPDEKKDFDAVMDRINNGMFQLRKRDDLPSEQGYPCVWLEWVQIYGELPHATSSPSNLRGPDALLAKQPHDLVLSGPLGEAQAGE